ncbi:carbon-nitrogen hydrolase family protein [Telmatocola sphagniphila]|uniref:Carbon-nitrogen hydrolase family protein n=1 Tax=Telmatocola sphagniphila TaxID=1123043 RepID=A0A8E6B4B6_9BACT|nr:carbon-nitrogen hydrolase family protein [Telmatocola sphagniphila]QVL31059.1 carbon-nitrogen hydrolase family protein [Telmatocola sphagniphila]
MSIWRIAGVQFDCQLGAKQANLDFMIAQVRQAAAQGARLIVFPECALTGYGLTDRVAAKEVAEPLPGPATQAMTQVCQETDTFVVFGLIESAGDKLFNAAAIVGPKGLVAGFRKIHMPCIGIDRFLDKGDRPFEVYDLGGLKIGIGICFDNSFPESVRLMTLKGADLVLQPTNWADKAIKNATLVARVRAFENHIYYMAVNRIGNETGFHYIGYSSITDFNGEFLAFAEHDREAMIIADIDPEAARRKKVVHCVGEYEIDRVNWRRPEMYEGLV